MSCMEGSVRGDKHDNSAYCRYMSLSFGAEKIVALVKAVGGDDVFDTISSWR